MSHHLPYPMDEHKARIMCGDPIALAYKWIESYLENLNDRITPDEDYNSEPITMDELIETAMSHINVESGRWGGDYIVRGGAFEGFSVDPTFWDKLAIIKEIEIPNESRNSFFSCSC